MSTETTEAAAKKMPSGANAPYKIIPVGKKFVVKNNAGETKATFDKRAAAVDYLQALYASVPGAKKRAGKVAFTGKAKNRAPKEKAELEQQAMECVGPECARSFIDEAAFQAHVGAVHADIMAEVVEQAQRSSDRPIVGVSCPDCSRSFLDQAALTDHAEAVHTFDDIRMIVQEAISEKFATGGEYPNRIYTYVADLADDWVVFEASQGSQCDNYKCGYSIVDNVATLGEISEVRRRTVWEPVGANEPAGILSTSKENN